MEIGIENTRQTCGVSMGSVPTGMMTGIDAVLRTLGMDGGERSRGLVVSMHDATHRATRFFCRPRWLGLKPSARTADKHVSDSMRSLYGKCAY